MSVTTPPSPSTPTGAPTSPTSGTRTTRSGGPDRADPAGASACAFVKPQVGAILPFEQRNGQRPERGHAPTFFVDGVEMDVEGLVRPVVEAAGLELVEASFHGGPGRGIVKVTVDREGGVDLDTIGQLSERISRRLDLEGYDPGTYTLEVSSPGLERPLRRPDEFARRVGEKVKVKLVHPVEGTRAITGAIVEVGPDEVRIATDAGE